jgi:hypothetical protein
LEEVECVALAFVDKDRIIIHSTAEEICEDALTSALAQFDTKPEGLTRDDELLF